MRQLESGGGEVAPVREAFSDINCGPNNLRAWMRYRKVSSVSLARSLNTSEATISQLVNGRHGLTARWLRRIAPLLDIAPGMLLDYDPADLDGDTIDMLLTLYSRKGAARFSSPDACEGVDRHGSEPDSQQSILSKQ